jgi:hypothetical protein
LAANRIRTFISIGNLARVRLIVQIGALTDYDATLELGNDGVRLMAATNLAGALKTHPEWFWPGGRYRRAPLGR